MREHPDAVEADLARFYGIDIRDRWTRDEHGRRRLTLRMIYVRLAHLPLDAATTTLQYGQPWSRAEHLLDELRRRLDAFLGEKNPQIHPDRRAPRTAKTPTPERARALAAARARARERRRQVEAGLIT